MALVTKRMKCHLRSSMHLTEDRNFGQRSRTRVWDGNLYSIGLVARIIARDIVHNIRVLDRIYNSQKAQTMGMLDIVFFVFMQRWITSR